MYRRSSFFTCFLLIISFITLLFFPAVSNQKAFANTESSQLNANFNPEVNINNVLAISTEFDSVLFSQQASSPVPLPAANHLMLSLLVLERLNLEERITISPNAARSTDENINARSVQVEAGESYLISSLLALHMYEHSHSSAIALAEKLAGSEEECVKLMNQKAQQLKMENTSFTNVLGVTELADNETWSLDFDLINDASLLVQKSTLNDMAHLISALLKNPTATQMFNEREYYTRLPDSMIALHHPFDQIFSSVEQGITGAWNLRQDDMSFSMIVGEQNHIKYLVMMTDKTKNFFPKPLVDLVQRIANYYVVTPLVNQGQLYPSYDRTKEGDKIGLIFLKTIKYIHPATDTFIHPAVKYVSHGPHTRPLSRGTTVGHVVYTLNDGRQIQAEVGSDASILSGSTFFSTFINSLQQNPNLRNLIMGLIILLCFIMGAKIIKLAKSLSSQIKLYRLNLIQKKLKDRINKS